MNREYDPKLSEAGFMDLVLELRKQFKREDTQAFIRKKPLIVADSLRDLERVVNAYIDIVDDNITKPDF
jgi:hypothetical protein